MLLKGKTAAISGAASARGIGLATARLFAEHGARIAILDIDEVAAKAAAESLGPEHVGLGCDVANQQSCVLFLSQAFLPSMRARKKGSIACMSSVSAQRGGGIFGGPHYSAAKAGVLGLAKAMAREFGPDGIRVNCITPGLIQTDITGGKLTDEMRKDIIKGIPLSRLGDAADVAGCYLFLASDLSAYVTGAVIDVNGGMLIHG